MRRQPTRARAAASVASAGRPRRPTSGPELGSGTRCRTRSRDRARDPRWGGVRIGPKPHASTTGPTVGSKAPSLARATSSACSSTTARSSGRSHQTPGGMRLKRHRSESSRHVLICAIDTVERRDDGVLSGREVDRLGRHQRYRPRRPHRLAEQPPHLARLGRRRHRARGLRNEDSSSRLSEGSSCSPLASAGGL